LIILAPHKPGMITRWPLRVTPPRRRSPSAAVVLAWPIRSCPSGSIRSGQRVAAEQQDM